MDSLTKDTIITSLPRSLQHIVQTLNTKRHLKPADMRRIVLEAKVEEADLLPWADFEHPLTDSYGRKLIYKGGHFEVMVMSWNPGDFSTVHDHGYTQWGAVQVFGPAEHATFRIDNERIYTLARWQMQTGEAIGVHHDLLHQMGNPTKDQRFLSLHVYGDVEDVNNVTGEARVIDMENATIQRVNGGVFFALPPKEILRVEPGPKPDYPTRLRHMIELIRRLRKMSPEDRTRTEKDLDQLIADFKSPKQREQLLQCLQANTNDQGRQTNSVYWRILNWELREAATFQAAWRQENRPEDHFHQYASLYDAIIGTPSLDDFMLKYLAFFNDKVQAFREKEILSVGCGTGLVEGRIIDEFKVPFEQVYGIDISPAMVSEARKRIQADQGDILTLDPLIRLWDIAFSGLNVFHYLPSDKLENAIEKTADIVRPGGYFIGDFITPDHIRWYPNVVYSTDKKIISLRTPELVEAQGRMYQESAIINLDFTGDQMRVTYAGKHRRFLPPMHRIRQYFEKYFRGRVELFDAYSLEVLPDWADSCSSTRYVVIAQKY